MSELNEKLQLLYPGIRISSKHIGIVEQEKHYYDTFEIILHLGNKEITTQYSMGFGHRKPIYGVKKNYHSPYNYSYYNRFTGSNKNEHEAALAKWTKYSVPELADVLYSLLSDASSVDGSFEDWAENFGYDTDSRKALETYLACGKIRSDLMKFLGVELFEELSKLEH